MVVCVHIPRFELTTAAGGSEALAARPLALAPVTGGNATARDDHAVGGRTASFRARRSTAGLRVGEVSGAAEAHGVAAGMPLPEALARCPDLALVPADPLAVADAWEAAVGALEGIGAAVEPARPGLAYFEAGGLRGMYGSEREAILAARRALHALGRPARIGAGPTRLCALAAALESSARRIRVVDEAQVGRYLAAQPVGLLGFRAQTEALVEPLGRLGVRTLGELVALGRHELADRFGRPGAVAYRLACGEDEPPRPRAVQERLEESLDVGEANSGQMLERVLGVLVDRLLARPERRGRTLRALVLAARLVGEGTWSERVVLRQALADARRIRLTLSLRLALLPAPAQELSLRVERWGPAGAEQRTLAERDGVTRRERLGEAVSQVRAAAGPDAALRAVCVDPDSRVPERRVVLTPLPG